MNPSVEAFRDPVTASFSYVVFDQVGGHAAIVDPVLDFDPVSARTSTAGADRLLAFVAENALTVNWVLETHAHADHLTAGAYLRDRLGARLAIGRGIVEVQAWCQRLFNLGEDFRADGSQFDHLFEPDETFEIGAMRARVLATPGHTSEGVAYVIGDAVFVGDTLFAPDSGSARCDFPGGDAQRLYTSIQRILALPGDTRLYLCHDYPPKGRAPNALTTVALEAANNIHVATGIEREAFVRMRRERDATLPQPRLMLAALQVNIRGGRLPPADLNGISYLRLPLNAIGGAA